MDVITNEMEEVIYLGGGCFWCMEAVFQRIEGVTEVSSGYMGGLIKNPTYREVCSGLTGHVEVIKIVYEPDVLYIDTIMSVFFTSHDPTSLNRQGADVGTQYKSIVFCTTTAQKVDVEKYLRGHVSDFKSPIVTEIEDASEFYEAEDFHQNYYNINPLQSYCSIVIQPKLTKVRSKFSNIMKT